MQENLNAQDEAALEDIAARLDDFEKERGALIPILQMIQENLGYLPERAIHMTARRLGIPENEVYGVATFYNQFKFIPPGRHPIKVCTGTACHVKASDIILENFERKLEISDGETTPDREFSIEQVACVGCCALAPVALVGETVHGHMAPSKVEGIVLRIRMEREREKASGEKSKQ